VTPERWQQIDELFRSALEHAPEGRSAFLDQACAEDDPLRIEVKTLIASHDQSESFMEAPAFEDAAEMLVGDQVDPVEGQWIGPYKIVALLGEGGMGEVYLAEDVRLGRQIALKLLPAYFGKDEDRLRRFAQEARAASALNHPNVCVIYEVGETEDGRHYIAMEYVDGETLGQVTTSRRIGIDEVLEVTMQVASGLAAAHQVGIVHRDIKPENIMLRRDGYVKVLDFGLAKLTEQLTTNETSPAGARVKTDTGMVMGTGRYMSPEQARGLSVDARTDIWSLGVALYEMVTGRAPFEGATTGDLIVSILEREPPPLALLSPDAPAELQRIITKALRKEREERYQTAKDLLSDLKSLKQELELEVQLGHPLQRGSRGRSILRTNETLRATGLQPKWWPNRLILLGAVVISFVSVAGWFYSSRFASKLSTLSKSEPQLPPMKIVPFTSFFPGRENWPAFSPNGEQIAFTWDGPTVDNFDLYVKLVGSAGEPLRLTTHPGIDNSPAWSPDGKQIAFTRFYLGQSAIYTISALGGSERKLLQLGLESAKLGFYPMVVWSPDGRSLAFPDKSSPQEIPGIFLLSVESLEKRRLTSPPAQDVGDWWPAFSPDGKTVAFVRQIDEWRGDIYVASIDGGEPRRLTLDSAQIQGLDWTPDGGSIVFLSPRGEARLGLWRISASGGMPEPLAVGADIVWSPFGISPPSISRDGHRLAYVQSFDDANIWRIEVPSSAGRANPPTSLISSTQCEWGPQFSPDGKRIVFESIRSGPDELWVCESDGTNPIQLTFHGAKTPRWSPDGRHIAFVSRPEGHEDISIMSAEGGAPRRLTTDPANDEVPSWSRDGHWIYFSSNRTGTRQVWKVPAEGGQAVQVTKQGGYAAFESPDGQVLYYAKLESAGLWRMPVEGGEETLVFDQLQAGYWGAWAVADKGIYFINPEAKPRATIEFFSFATRRITRIAVLARETNNWFSNLAISPDGRWILYTQLDQGGNDIMLVENFQ
jgi:Tol biopolymer transport system component/predicted Ser/Thr protein kinase